MAVKLLSISVSVVRETDEASPSLQIKVTGEPVAIGRIPEHVEDDAARQRRLRQEIEDADRHENEMWRGLTRGNDYY